MSYPVDYLMITDRTQTLYVNVKRTVFPFGICCPNISSQHIHQRVVVWCNIYHIGMHFWYPQKFLFANAQCEHALFFFFGQGRQYLDAGNFCGKFVYKLRGIMGNFEDGECASRSVVRIEWMRICMYNCIYNHVVCGSDVLFMYVRTDMELLFGYIISYLTFPVIYRMYMCK